MYDLSNFYQSKEWINLLKQIRQERINDEGYIVCEYCEKPIIKKFDCIGHHKEQLTEDNVNDFTISLNPDNIALVHHKCHNYIHNKFGYKRKEIYLIYGSPCSGKSTYLESVMEAGDLIIDLDRIRQAINGQPTHVLTPKLNAISFGIRDYLMDCVRMRNGKWNRAYIIGGFPMSAERERICKDTGAIEIYIESTKEECLARLEAEPNNRDIEKWKGFIDSWWEQYTR